MSEPMQRLSDALDAERQALTEHDVHALIRATGAKLDALRRDIREGLDSGAPEPLDMATIKAEARRRRTAKGE